MGSFIGTSNVHIRSLSAEKPAKENLNALLGTGVSSCRYRSWRRWFRWSGCCICWTREDHFFHLPRIALGFVGSARSRVANQAAPLMSRPAWAWPLKRSPGFLFGTSATPTAFEASQNELSSATVELLGGSPGRQLPKCAGASFETYSGGNNAAASNLIGDRARRAVRCISPYIRADTRFGLLLSSSLLSSSLLPPPVLPSPLLRPALLSPPVLSSPLL